MINKEEWCPVRGYEGLYEVSNFGNVRSLNYNKTGEIKLLSTVEDNKGYLSVCLHKNGKQKKYLVHRLVAEAFIPNTNNLPQVNHKSEVKTDNRVENLEWCTASYNINFGTRNDRHAKLMSKPVLQYTKTGDFIREWSSTRECGRNGFNQSGVQKCCLGKTRLKSYKGYIWKYK